MAQLDGFIITCNEEELLGYCLESFRILGDRLGTLSIVDNNSTDATLDIIESYRPHLNIVLQHERSHSHHGKMRTRALEPLSANWIVYLDADETWTSNFPTWLGTGELEQGDIWEFHKWSTIVDRYHHAGGDGPSQRLFRNLPGVNFPQSIHTEPHARSLDKKRLIPGVYAFDHTGCKSEEALYAKGWRYQWATGVPGIGPYHEYTGRVADAHARGTIQELPDKVRQFIFTGPE